MKGLIGKKKKSRGSCTKPLRLKDLRRRPCYTYTKTLIYSINYKTKVKDIVKNMFYELND